ncbi:Hypothetical predicted protein [Pelobates cultripes]|uniref:Uncharacterized protein n=1 Tax=Pelobates cultripes TaxID=61616 RepID=A0AAD1VV01_PELCU|nr:Hypothetical predicted protein [Pelobates cultripes]
MVPSTGTKPNIWALIYIVEYTQRLLSSPKPSPLQVTNRLEYNGTHLPKLTQTDSKRGPLEANLQTLPIKDPTYKGYAINKIYPRDMTMHMGTLNTSQSRTLAPRCHYPPYQSTRLHSRRPTPCTQWKKPLMKIYSHKVRGLNSPPKRPTTDDRTEETEYRCDLPPRDPLSTLQNTNYGLQTISTSIPHHK